MTKKELKEIIEEDKLIYFGNNLKQKIFKRITKYNLCEIGKYIIVSRKKCYYSQNRKSFINFCLYMYYTRKKNMLGTKLNIELDPTEFGRRLKIYHGNIVVNGNCKIGNDCSLYGDNCIGNNGTMHDLNDVPIIGNNVSFGVGSKVIGKIIIADDTIIGAGSVVNKSCLEKGKFLVGIPAQIKK